MDKYKQISCYWVYLLWDYMYALPYMVIPYVLFVYFLVLFLFLWIIYMWKSWLKYANHQNIFEYLIQFWAGRGIYKFEKIYNGITMFNIYLDNCCVYTWANLYRESKNIWIKKKMCWFNAISLWNVKLKMQYHDILYEYANHTVP